MQLTVNHKPVEIEAATLTVRELLERLNYQFPLIFVKVNGKVIKKNLYASLQLIDGDVVEAIHLMGGG